MFANLKLGSKLWGFTAVLLGLLVLTSGLSMYFVRDLLTSNSAWSQAVDDNQFMTEKEVDHLVWVNKAKDLFVHDLKGLDVQFDHTKCGLGEFLYGDKGEKMAARDAGLRTLIEGIKTPHKELHASAIAIQAAWEKGDKDEARTLFTDKTLPALAQTQAQMKALRDKLAGDSLVSKESMQQQGSRAQWLSAILSISGIVAGLLLGFVIIRSIIGPIMRIITDLSAGSVQAASASGQVATAGQSLAEGAAEQASSLEEISSSLEEMAAMTRQSADHADSARTLAGDARGAAESGNRSMQEMREAMDQIQSASSRTRNIIKTIDEIAFQTNLLALNAAVEAARAGDAGKGFAVVAEEVRSLALRAGNAARDTADLIEESVKSADTGGAIASRMGDALAAIDSGTGKVASLVEEIAAAAREQSQGIAQVNMAMGQMDRVTQQNASNAEEAASAAQEMNAQAHAMNAVVADLVALVGGAASDAGMDHASAPRTHAAQYNPNEYAAVRRPQVTHSIAAASSRAVARKPAVAGTALRPDFSEQDFDEF